MTTTTRTAHAPLHVWLTTAEAATHCRMSQRHLMRLTRSGRLRGEQVGGRGGHWRFHIDWLEALLGNTSTSARAS